MLHPTDAPHTHVNKKMATESLFVFDYFLRNHILLPVNSE